MCNRRGKLCVESLSEEYPHGGEEAYCWNKKFVRDQGASRHETKCLPVSKTEKCLKLCRSSSKRCRLFTGVIELISFD